MMPNQASLRLDVVVPVYNEGENILKLLGAFEQQVKTHIRLLICYDREDDSTVVALRRVSSLIPLVLVRNAGHGVHGAVITGFAVSDAPAVISYMADDDYNAGLIDRMATAFLEGSDVVCASRFMPGGSMQGCRWQKSILVRSVALTLRVFGRLPVHDPTNAFRLVSRRLLNQVHIESEQGFAYSIELLAKCHRLGWRISEVPAQWFERQGGGSRFRILEWATGYLRWYLYIFATTFLHRREI